MAVRFRQTPASPSARLEEWGGHRSRVYPRSAINVRKSGKPDLRVRDAAHKAAVSGVAQHCGSSP